MKIDEFLIFENFFLDPRQDGHVAQEVGYVQRRYMAHFEAIIQGYKICIYVTLEMSRHVTLIAFFLNFGRFSKKIFFKNFLKNEFPKLKTPYMKQLIRMDH